MCMCGYTLTSKHYYITLLQLHNCRIQLIKNKNNHRNPPTNGPAAFTKKQVCYSLENVIIHRCWCCLTCCGSRSHAPYRCRLALSSTSKVTCTARHRKPLKWPRPVPAATVTLSPQLRSPDDQLFSSWSPILRSRDASSWATEQAEERRRDALQLESPGRSRGWSIGSQHIFSSNWADALSPSSL